MHLAMRHSLLWEKHEISMSIMVLAARQPERMGPGGGRVVQVKRAVCVIFLFFFSLIFRSCHGRVVAIPGTQTTATPTTASQTPGTSPAQWWSSGSKLDIRVCLEHKDTGLLWTDLSYRKVMVPTVHNEDQGWSLTWPFGSEDPMVHQIL